MKNVEQNTRAIVFNELRSTLVIGLVAAMIASCAPARMPATTTDRLTGAHDFDFLAGAWRVHHRRLTPDGRNWVAFDGTCSNRPIMGGAANLEEHILNAPNGMYRAVALRAFDAKSGEWAIWWLDGRYPSGPLDPSLVKGHFENGTGRFYAEYTQSGKLMRGRFLWSNITPNSARWEQGSSADGGKTWNPNWMMRFERDQSNGAFASANRTNVSDFDFLQGDWHVHHRYLRVNGDRREWADAEGTAHHRALMNGRANIEEHAIDAPGGTYRAAALRSYDPKTSQWSIWWLDGRVPHGDLDPPMRGSFENGRGAFYGDATVSGTRTRARIMWSEIASDSARWEQAYSSDAGKTWEPHWIMTFTRRH